MRGKLIAIFAAAVLVVGGVSFALARMVLGGLSTAADPTRAGAAAVTALHLQGALLERYLAAQSSVPAWRAPFDAGTPTAQADQATAAANQLREQLQSALPEIGREVQLVALVTPKGVVLGRNGSNLMRGDDLAKAYPGLADALGKGVTGSDAWITPARNEQLLVSYGPLRNDKGELVGGLVVGTALNDGRLSGVSNGVTGQPLVAVRRGDAGIEVLARSASASDEVVAALKAGAAKDELGRALATPGQSVDLGGLPSQHRGAGRALDGYGDGKRVAIVCVAQEKAGEITAPVGWSILGATAIGLVLVLIAAFMLDSYLSRPIAELEDGLLAIMNGREDLRFEIEHAELGGLVFRINSLLNQLLGVQEDDTDAEGRVSRAPSPQAFGQALSVDERMASPAASAGSAEARALRDEAEGEYYDRVYREYIEAKRTLGDPVDHITKDAFLTRLRSNEQEMADKHGKPVRYKVEVRDKEVVLLAIPLS